MGTEGVSAFGGKADTGYAGLDVRSRPLADITRCPSYVRLRRQSGHRRLQEINQNQVSNFVTDATDIEYFFHLFKHFSENAR
jgi:hypothetical protein